MDRGGRGGGGQEVERHCGSLADVSCLPAAPRHATSLICQADSVQLLAARGEKKKKKQKRAFISCRFLITLAVIWSSPGRGSGPHRDPSANDRPPRRWVMENKTLQQRRKPRFSLKDASAPPRSISSTVLLQQSQPKAISSTWRHPGGRRRVNYFLRVWCRTHLTKCFLRATWTFWK